MIDPSSSEEESDEEHTGKGSGRPGHHGHHHGQKGSPRPAAKVIQSNGASADFRTGYAQSLMNS